MSAVDAGFGQTLKSISSVAEVGDAAVAARWGVGGIATDVLSPLEMLDDALNEAARQLAFLAGPMVVEQVSIAGQRRDLIGQAVTIHADRGGYAQGAGVFVIGFDEQEGNRTLLTVLRKLE